MSIDEFVQAYFNGNKSEFARANNVPRQRVNDWVNAGYVIVDGWLYSPRKRRLSTTVNGNI